MILHIKHRTNYSYSESASQSHNHVCLQPRQTNLQTCLETLVQVTPEPDTFNESVDVYGNKSTLFSLSNLHRECDIVVTSLVETTDTLPPLPSSLNVAGNAIGLTSAKSSDELMAIDCLLPSPFIQASSVLDDFINELPIQKLGVLEYAHALMEHIYSTFRYDPGFSTLVTPLSEIYANRRGVCQDFAHLAIAALRRQGIPARYVSGYLETLPPPGQKKLQGSDASHAWFSVYDANNGWYDFDPTNNKRPDAQYITTAWGRDYADVTPIKGVVYGGGEHTLTVAVDVTRTSEFKLSSVPIASS